MHIGTHALDILVFKTSVHSPSDVVRLEDLLETDDRILRWNVDLEDVDKVLRIVSNTLTAPDVIRLLGAKGFTCEELPD
ncbi:hypothetical protein [Siphonobacter aquaeclarae]|jgi:hypothetical protein|uniref:HMA domain-containing protein n=1 Tax=Siphonobacter aquaeclarae TaxID=563176 RepID=A0A1G9SNE6_9BACT|nr:hypothetical protein [Siphonobacter aquaeclarae]MBO9637533.1 hypothetical protein [Siphonobacter aquaeclarae]SDM36847.1 hypothetical protein SAMN04488090_3234 [Siphonobacter aquaeclarae]